MENELLKTKLEEGKEELEQPEAEPVQEQEADVEPVAETSPVDGTSPEAEPQPVEETPVVEENGSFETSIRTFTQPEVDKMVGDTRVKTREKTFRYIYDRYGVNSEEELDNLVSNAQKFETSRDMWNDEKRAMETERDESKKQIQDMSEQLALMQSEINPERYEDAKLILKGKGMEITLENIQSELETHPEWKKEERKEEPEQGSAIPAPAIDPNLEQGQEQAEEKPQPHIPVRIKTLGNEAKPTPQPNEEEEAEKLFKMKFTK